MEASRRVSAGFRTAVPETDTDPDVGEVAVLQIAQLDVRGSSRNGPGEVDEREAMLRHRVGPVEHDLIFGSEQHAEREPVHASHDPANASTASVTSAGPTD